jgi:hypothetical protein
MTSNFTGRGKLAVAVHQLGRDISLLLRDELAEPTGVLRVVAPPIVVELEAREMPVGVMDRTRLAEGLVAVAADAERAENIKIGLLLEG